MVRFDQAQQHARQRGFPAAAFADDREGLARSHFETDVIHRHEALRLAFVRENASAAHETLSADCALPAGTHTARTARRESATAWRNSGRPDRIRSRRNGQRGAKAQPGRQFRQLRHGARNRRQFAALERWRCGEQSLRVRVLRRREHFPHWSFLHDASRRTSRRRDPPRSPPRPDRA